MNDRRYTWILYLIIVVIIGTITIQVYWNYKNYVSNKRQFINDVQISLDNAVDAYYTNLAERTTIGYAFEGKKTEKNSYNYHNRLDSILEMLNLNSDVSNQFDTISLTKIKGVSIIKGAKNDSVLNSMQTINGFPRKFKVYTSDSLKTNKFQALTTKIIISMANDSISLKEIDTLLKGELARKKMTLDYHISYKNPHRVSEYSPFNKFEIHKDSSVKSSFLSAVSKSSFLPNASSLTVYFTNETKLILKRSLLGILISTILILAIFSSLFYLLKIIRRQKQLAEVKNDLISNITHEFKTPIATISVALESLRNFNSIEDKGKTKRYIDISTNHLSKLTTMVEKLLETATLDRDNLQLNIEQVDVIELLTTLSNSYRNQHPKKTVQTSFKQKQFYANVDVFHFENALNNIMDNAIKYGGDLITIDLISKNRDFEITISDNGNGINKGDKERIFEKFYRIPKGNTHDVKGYGIGLYYTKTIIDKHGGSIFLDPKNSRTSFKIIMPNA